MIFFEGLSKLSEVNFEKYFGRTLKRKITASRCGLSRMFLKDVLKGHLELLSLDFKEYF